VQSEPPAPDRLAAMIALQRSLQETHMLRGNTFADLTTLERVRYVRDMYVAAIKELGEVLDETTWKPWSVAQPAIHDDHVFGELIDVWHFLMNLFLVTRPQATSEEIAAEIYRAYQRKRQINVERQVNGYAGGGKCPLCARALDDVGSATDPTGEFIMCLGCHSTFPAADAT